MKLILISPFNSIRSYGIRILSACLKKEGHDVRIVFLRKNFWDKYKDQTVDEVVELSKGFDLIGMTLMTNNFDDAVQVTKRLKTLNTPILWGGIHPTIRPEECLEHADMICMGEGEESIVELANKMKDGQDFREVNIKGIWTRKRKTGLRPLIQDLDSVPFPDYDYKDHYILSGHIRKMDEALLKRYSNGIYMTMPTRGCPFGCAYCYNNTHNELYKGQKLIRKRRIDNIIKELTIRKNFDRVKFDDDAFFIYTDKEIEEFCIKYKKNVGLPLIITGVNPSILTRKKLSLLVDAGLIFIRMGIQSGSERTKKLYRRFYSNQEVIKNARMINEFKNKIEAIQYDIILDNPWETEQDLIKTLMLLSRLPVPYFLSLFSLTLYPATELYEKAKREGVELGDAYRKYFHRCKKTYLNRLFFLLKAYTQYGGRISPRMMSLLTKRHMWLYIILKIWVAPFRRIKRFRYLLGKVCKGLKDMQKGDFWLIKRLLKRLSRH